MEPALDAAERAAIEDFLIDYAHTIDDGELQSWPHRFTEDGVYKITTARASMVDCHWEFYYAKAAA